MAKRAGEMNKTERRYADNLEMKRLAGAILRWEFEPECFELAYRCTYTSDFRIVYPDGRPIEFHEVKGGFTREDSWIKLKITARMFPQYRFILVKWDGKKGWIFKEVQQ